MLLHKSVVHDSRVRREAKALALAGHEVTVVHLGPVTVPADVSAEGYRVMSAVPRRLGRRHLPGGLHRMALIRRFVGAIRSVRPDVVHAHDAAMLAPGWVGSRLVRARLVYDAHELATGVAYHGKAWARAVWALESLVVPKCVTVITVSEGIAERLQALYRLGRRPAVVRNVPDLPPPNGHPGLRERLNIGDAPLIIHQGAAAPGRGCGILIEALTQLPDAHLLFLGDPDPGYSDRLFAMAAGVGVAERVHMHGSVPLARLLSYTAEADVGVSLLEATCDNHLLALPNKVFEYMAAGVPVVASDFGELRRELAGRADVRLVDPHAAGQVADALAELVALGPSAGDRPAPIRTFAEEAAVLLAEYAALDASLG